MLPWLLAALVAMCFSMSCLVFVFQNFFAIRQGVPVLIVIAILLTPLVQLVTARYIQPRLKTTRLYLALILLTLALISAIALVVRAPEAVITDPLDHLVAHNPALQRLVQSEMNLRVDVTGEKNPRSAGDAVELGYLTSQYGDISFSQIELAGDWERTDSSLATPGGEDTALAWHGHPGENLTMVFIASPTSGIVEVLCGDEKQVVDLFSDEQKDLIVECTYARQSLSLLSSLFTFSLVGCAVFLMLLFFAFLSGKGEKSALAQVIVPSFFVLYLLLGLWVYQDYGLSTDEPAQRAHGMVSAKYIVQSIDPGFRQGLLNSFPDLKTYWSKSYGVAFHLPLAMFEILTDFSEVSQMWLFRHYATFLFFFFGTAAFYRLAREKLDNWMLGLLGTAFLILSPRIFAESFYNVKDTTFLAAFTIALLFGFRYWRKPNLLDAALFGAAAAFATNVRIIASLLVIGVIVYALLRRARPLGKLWVTSVAVMLVYLPVLFMLWPASWGDPLSMFAQSFSTFSDYTRWDGMIMYRGELIRGQNPPLGYLPVWITITTPALYLILFIAGAISAFVRGIGSFKHLFQDEAGEDLVFLALVCLPPLAAIVRGSTLYSAWRHFFFIYPPLLIIALVGLKSVWTMTVERIHNSWQRVVQALLVFTISASIFTTARWMIINHPYQNTFFSAMASAFGGSQGFERDYWRLSVRQGLEYVLENDDRQQINIRVENWLVQLVEILPADDRARLQLTRPNGESPDYLFRTYRNPFGNYPDDKFHEIVVDGLPILTIYALPGEPGNP